MSDQPDPGQVTPGTQKPIEIFFVVSRTELNPSVGEYTPGKLADLFRGTERSREIAEEYAIFTDRTSADNFAVRQSLLETAIRHLRGLTTEQLEEIAPALSRGNIDGTIDSLNRYTE